jgi:drug/metabolite transporter (DMT)-like permease
VAIALALGTSLVCGFLGGIFSRVLLASARGYLSLVSMLASLHPVATILAAFLYLHERISRTQRARGTLVASG